MAEKDLELFCHPGSYYSIKVLLGLAEKNLSYKKRLVMLDTLENHSDWYLKINPSGQVPTLRCGDRYISDSHQIIAFLDDTFGDPLLLPKKPKEASDVVERLVVGMDALDVPVLSYGAGVHRELTKNPKAPGFMFSHMRAKIKANFLTKTLEDELAAHPEMADHFEPKIKANKLVLGRMRNKTAVVEEIDRTRNILEDAEDQLKRVGFSKDSTSKCWLVGPHFTYADISLGVLLGRMEFIGYGHVLWENGKLPLVEKYFEQMKKRPSYIEIYSSFYSFPSLVRFMATTVFKSVGPYALLVGAVFMGALAYYWMK